MTRDNILRFSVGSIDVSHSLRCILIKFNLNTTYRGSKCVGIWLYSCLKYIPDKAGFHFSDETSVRSSILPLKIKN